MPVNTDENRVISFFRVTDGDPEKFDFAAFLKLYSLITDARAATTFPSGGLVDGHISIFDCTNFSFGHLMKLLGSFSLVRLFLRYSQEALPHVLYQNHFINCSPIIPRILSLVRPFLTKQVKASMYFHQGGHEALQEYFTKKVLPFEYGGDAGEINEIYKQTVSVLMPLREYFNDESFWKISV